MKDSKKNTSKIEPCQYGSIDDGGEVSSAKDNLPKEKATNKKSQHGWLRSAGLVVGGGLLLVLFVVSRTFQQYDEQSPVELVRTSSTSTSGSALTSNWGKIEVVNNCGSNTMVMCKVGKDGPEQKCTKAAIQSGVDPKNLRLWLTSGTSMKNWGNCYWKPEKCNNNNGGATLAELHPLSEFINLSKVKGFNVGVQIKGGGNSVPSWDLTCLDVNCPDAYFLCDTGSNKMFSPNKPVGSWKDGVTVTFCPDHGTNSNSNIFHRDNKCGFTANQIVDATYKTTYVCSDPGDYRLGKGPNHWVCRDPNQSPFYIPGVTTGVECPGGLKSDYIYTCPTGFPNCGCRNACATKNSPVPDTGPCNKYLPEGY